MGASFTSSSQNLDSTLAYCIQAIWASGSTPVGTITLQGSLDDSTYTDLTTASVSGNSGSVMFNIERPAYRYVRFTYTRTSGSATMTSAYINGVAV